MQAILTFKIELGDFSATIILPAHHTLEILAESILEAVGFDMDHRLLTNSYHTAATGEPSR